MDSSTNHPIPIILNPAARRGTAGEAAPRIENLLKIQQVAYNLTYTGYPGHASVLAAEAASRGEKVVVAAGGDGTVNEVLNGLITAREGGLPVPDLAVLPIGRGNDFAYSMGLPMDLPAACQALTGYHRRLVDVGWLEGDGIQQRRFFGNGVGIGFDAWAAYEAGRMPKMGGFLGYLVAVLVSLAVHFRSPLVRMTVDGQQFVKHMMLLSIMNGQRLGGGFRVAPQGNPNDGHFDVAIIDRVSRFTALTLLPRFINGSHLTHPAVDSKQAARIEIETLHGTLAAHVDGEIITLTSQKMIVQILPDALNLVTNSK